MVTKTILVLFLSLTLANGQLYESLYKKLVKKGIKNTIPISSPRQPVNVSLSLMVVGVNSLDPETGDLDLDAWMNMQWRDGRLTWNPEDFSNITKINIAHSDFWKPDIVTYGGRAQQFPELGIVNNDGSVVYIPVVRIRYRCNVSNYVSNGTVTCNIKLGSWTYSGFNIDLQQGQGGAVDGSEFTAGRWDLVDASGKRNVAKYDCCPEPYPNVVATLVFKDLRSKKGYFNIF